MLARRPCGEEHRQAVEQPGLACRKSAFVLIFLGRYLVLFCKQPCRQLPEQSKNYAGVSSGAHKHLRGLWCCWSHFQVVVKRNLIGEVSPHQPPQPSTADNRYFKDGHEIRRGLAEL